ncbi:MAG TPA: helix-turn-helix domain-containing protein [Acidimicrobiales bacterium]|jgi:excisionase family DNA binding protein|nr:helix-turn-helix domain-containing protein [Acidimicrobiales bacterium]
MEPKREALLSELFGDGQVPPMLAGRLLRTREVAQLFQVSERTVAEWARRGRIPSVRTPGGHRLYPAEEVRRLLVSTEGLDRPAGGQAQGPADGHPNGSATP